RTGWSGGAPEHHGRSRRARGVTMEAVGFVGLGNMGSVLAANLVEKGYAVVAHDADATKCAPDGARRVTSVADVARDAAIVGLSLPDGAAAEAVVGEIVGAADRCTTHVVDTSTIGVRTAAALADTLADAGLAYVDAPVSGGVAGAKARTLAVMYAASDDACARVEP